MTSSLGDSLARTFQSQADNRDSTAQGQFSFMRLPGYLGRYDLDSPSLRTLEIYSLTKAGKPSKRSSKKLPAQGMMRSGALYRRLIWEPATEGTDTGSCASVRTLPTPTTRDWKDGTAKACRNVPSNSLLGRVIHEVCSETGDDLSLNPAFVEEMMGFPAGWTDLNNSETL